MNKVGPYKSACALAIALMHAFAFLPALWAGLSLCELWVLQQEKGMQGIDSRVFNTKIGKSELI